VVVISIASDTVPVGSPRQLKGGEVEVPSHVYVVGRDPSDAVALLDSVKVIGVTGVVTGGVVTAASAPPQATSHSAACSATTGRHGSTGSGSRDMPKHDDVFLKL
jgi:hypothetical protein